MTKDKTQIIRMDKELYDRAKAMADSKGISVSGLIRMYLIEGLNKEAPKN